MCDPDALEVLFDLVEDVGGDEVDVINRVEPVLQSAQRLPDLIPKATKSRRTLTVRRQCRYVHSTPDSTESYLRGDVHSASMS